MQSKKRELSESKELPASAGCQGATVRIGAARAVPAVLDSLGADPAVVLGELGLAPTLFDNPDNRISFALRSRLFKHCVDRTGCRHFGLLVGLPAGLHSLGLVGLLVQHSPDVGSALRNLVRSLHLHVRGAVANLAVNEHTAALSFSIYAIQVEATDQIGDGAVAVMFNVLRTLCGPDWKPVEVQFAHRRPDDLRPFQEAFRTPLRFDAEQNAVVFAIDWLRRPIAGADAELHRLFKAQIDVLELAHGSDFQEQVRALLRSLLIAGHASADRIAEIFSMHTRTLRRRLNACGTSVQLLIDEGRFEIARQMLMDTDMEIQRIAVTLEYADASAFTRAFRRWSGVTPSQWRAIRGRPNQAG